MTPFDPAALLAMLLAFYPVASPAALGRAMAERPEYFAGAVRIGRGGDAIQLPDGRIFDLIFAVDDPIARHWQVIEAGAGDGADDPFADGPGPLTPLDPNDATPAPAVDMFTGLVGEALAALGASDAVLDAAGATLAEHAADAANADAGGVELDDAADALDQQIRARGAVELGDELDALDALDQGAAGVEGDYDAAPERPRLPPDPTPGKPPDAELPPTEPAPE